MMVYLRFLSMKAVPAGLLCAWRFSPAPRILQLCISDAASNRQTRLLKEIRTVDCSTFVVQSLQLFFLCRFGIFLQLAGEEHQGQPAKSKPGNVWSRDGCGCAVHEPHQSTDTVVESCARTLPCATRGRQVFWGCAHSQQKTHISGNTHPKVEATPPPTP